MVQKGYRKFLWCALILCALFCVSLGSAAPVSAATHHHHKKHHHAAKKHHAVQKTKAKKTASQRERVRTAQIALAELGYKAGKFDGVLGARTKAALKQFQRDHHLLANGQLTARTYTLLLKEAHRTKMENVAPVRMSEFYGTHPDFYGYYARAYGNPNMLGSPQAISNRFADLQISEERNGPSYEYTITLNGQTVLKATSQPSPMRVSRTFSLDGADAVLFTTYDAGDTSCPYRHYLLTLRAQSDNLRDLNNCAADYETHVANGSLFVSFQDGNADDAVGETWRYENGTLVKL